MDNLLQLSNLACQAERLEDPLSSSSCASVPSSSSSSASSSPSSSSSGSRQNSRDGPLTIPFVRREPVPETKSVAESILPTDRQSIREKIKLAFKKKAATYEELLELCSSVSELKVYENAPTKLDYYKSGIACCKNIFDVRNNNNQSTAAPCTDKGEIKNAESLDNTPRGVKRAKTQH